MNATRGERNNNPGNIRESPGDRTNWVGERATDDDKSFEEFNTPSDGIRALAVVLLTYYRKYHLTTIRQIIDRWAPPVENDTESYVDSVAEHVGWPANDDLCLDNSTQLSLLVTAIIKHENGRCIYSPSMIVHAVERALA